MSDLEHEGPSLEEMFYVLMNQLQRIYDVELVMLGLMNQESANSVIAAHEQFKNIGPLPFKEK